MWLNIGDGCQFQFHRLFTAMLSLITCSTCCSIVATAFSFTTSQRVVVLKSIWDLARCGGIRTVSVPQSSDVWQQPLSWIENVSKRAYYWQCIVHLQHRWYYRGNGFSITSKVTRASILSVMVCRKSGRPSSSVSWPFVENQCIHNLVWTMSQNRSFQLAGKTWLEPLDEC